ncbi:MAG: methionine--tRNA ligase, partial [Candidatus Colwellbacteria bacterium]|nr:methionine--tRNA ligase [Candidatus Colwellbacteria bacterium]
IRSGLEDVSFSRARKSLAWVIPIQESDQTMYVWCDALSNYITAVGYGARRAREAAPFKKWWPADVHLVGKDITRFHAVFWPAMLMAARLPLPKKLLAHGFITVDGQKMSKTLGNIIDPVALVAKYGVDPVRYYLLRELPSDEDGDFSVAKFEARYRDDLSRGLGNFASRVSALAAPLRFAASLKPSREVAAWARAAEKLVRENVDSFKLHDAVAAIFELVRRGDGYVNAHRVWASRDQRRVYDLVFLLLEVGRLIAPFLPETSGRIIGAFITSKGGTRVRKIVPLFPRRDQTSDVGSRSLDEGREDGKRG